MFLSAFILHRQTGNNAGEKYRSLKLRQIARGPLMRQQAKRKRNRFAGGGILSLAVGCILIKYL
jgi:hypothetical protein